jgi:hypothetical protein
MVEQKKGRFPMLSLQEYMECVGLQHRRETLCSGAFIKRCSLENKWDKRK